MVPETKHEAAVIEESTLRYEKIKKKGMFCFFKRTKKFFFLKRFLNLNLKYSLSSKN